MPQTDNIQFIRSRLASQHSPEPSERSSLPEMLRGQVPVDRAWALAMFELLAEIDRLHAAMPAISPDPAITPGASSRVQFRAELSAAEYAEALTAALAGDASLLIAAFKAQRGTSALAAAYRRHAMSRSLRASLEEQTR